MTSKRNETEAMAKAEAKTREEECSRNRRNEEEAKKKDRHSLMIGFVKARKKEARGLRRLQNMEDALLSERGAMKNFFESEDVHSEVLETAKLVLDSLTDFVDLYASGDSVVLEEFCPTSKLALIAECVKSAKTHEDVEQLIILVLQTVHFTSVSTEVFFMLRTGNPSLEGCDVPVAFFSTKNPRFARLFPDPTPAILEMHAKRLGVAPDASKQEIVKAFRKAGKSLHPDKFTAKEGGISKEEAEEEFKKLSNAKEFMLNQLGGGCDGAN